MYKIYRIFIFEKPMFIADLDWNHWMTLLKVLQFLKESLSKPAPVPFAQNAQYKKNMSRDEDDGDEDEIEKPAQAKTQCKTKKKKNRKPKKGPARICDAKAAKQPVAEPSETEEYSPHRYTLLRKRLHWQAEEWWGEAWGCSSGLE